MRKATDGMARIGSAVVALALFGALPAVKRPRRGGDVTKQSAVSTEPPEMAAATIPRFQTQCRASSPTRRR
jgi:hypothetical protein